MKKILTIAGSDSSGGAGIQADLKTFENLGVWGLSVITSLTSQNTQGVTDSIPIPSDFVYKQIESIALDIDIDAVKIGMLFSKENVKVVSKAIRDFKLKNVVVDTVFISKNGKPLLEKEGIEIMRDYLFPLSSIMLVMPCLGPIPENQFLFQRTMLVSGNEGKMASGTMRLRRGHHWTERTCWCLLVRPPCEEWTGCPDSWQRVSLTGRKRRCCCCGWRWA